jgi:hypothetical protein
LQPGSTNPFNQPIPDQTPSISPSTYDSWRFPILGHDADDDYDKEDYRNQDEVFTQEGRQKRDNDVFEN